MKTMDCKRVSSQQQAYAHSMDPVLQCHTRSASVDQEASARVSRVESANKSTSELGFLSNRVELIKDHASESSFGQHQHHETQQQNPSFIGHHPQANPGASNLFLGESARFLHTNNNYATNIDHQQVQNNGPFAVCHQQHYFPPPANQHFTHSSLQTQAYHGQTTPFAGPPNQAQFSDYQEGPQYQPVVHSREAAHGYQHSRSSFDYQHTDYLGGPNYCPNNGPAFEQAYSAHPHHAAYQAATAYEYGDNCAPSGQYQSNGKPTTGCVQLDAGASGAASANGPNQDYAANQFLNHGDGDNQQQQYAGGNYHFEAALNEPTSTSYSYQPPNNQHFSPEAENQPQPFRPLCQPVIPETSRHAAPQGAQPANPQHYPLEEDRFSRKVHSRPIRVVDRASSVGGPRFQQLNRGRPPGGSYDGPEDGDIVSRSSGGSMGEQVASRRGQSLRSKTNFCSICGRNYARPSTLKTHLRTHTNERPYKCKICGKTFSQAANLTAHRRVHTGERPFKCPICCRPFSQSSSVITHLRTHSGKWPFLCDFKTAFDCISFVPD